MQPWNGVLPGDGDAAESRDQLTLGDAKPMMGKLESMAARELVFSGGTHASKAGTFVEFANARRRRSPTRRTGCTWAGRASSTRAIWKSAMAICGATPRSPRHSKSPRRPCKRFPFKSSQPLRKGRPICWSSRTATNCPAKRWPPARISPSAGKRSPARNWKSSPNGSPASASPRRRIEAGCGHRHDRAPQRGAPARQPRLVRRKATALSASRSWAPSPWIAPGSGIFPKHPAPGRGRRRTGSGIVDAQCI